MPIGPFKDFAACVAFQKKEGKNDEEAKKICGALERKVNQSDGSFSNHIKLKAITKKKSTIEVLRVGTLQDRGLKITPQMLKDFVKHFEEDVYGTELQVNLGHNEEGEAAGWITKLSVKDDKLMAEIKWTELGQDKIKKNLFKFVSAEFATKFPHHKTGEKVNNVFMGLALINVPALKEQEALALKGKTLKEKQELALNQLFINNKTMEELKKVYDALMEAESIGVKTLADFTKLASESEEKEAKKMLTEVIEKSVKLAEEKEEEEKKEEEKKEEEEKEKASEAKAEKQNLKDANIEIEKLREEQVKLNEKVERQELTEHVGKKMCLSSNVKTGFIDDNVKEIVNFMINLSQDQREQFEELLSKVQTVDLSVKGSISAKKLSKESEDHDTQVVELADKIQADAKAKGETIEIEDAQKMATEQLKSK